MGLDMESVPRRDHSCGVLSSRDSGFWALNSVSYRGEKVFARNGGLSWSNEEDFRERYSVVCVVLKSSGGLSHASFR